MYNTKLKYLNGESKNLVGPAHLKKKEKNFFSRGLKGIRTKNACECELNWTKHTHTWIRRTVLQGQNSNQTGKHRQISPYIYKKMNCVCIIPRYELPTNQKRRFCFPFVFTFSSSFYYYYSYAIAIFSVNRLKFLSR